MTMLAGLAAAVMVGPFLTVQYGMLGASASFAFGTFVAFLVASFWTRRHISW
jgi:preprotein translocase subunit SecD